MSERKDIRDIVESLHPFEIKILFALGEKQKKSDEELIRETSLDKAQKDMATGWLLTKGIVRIAGEKTEETVTLTETGKKYKEWLVPELRIFNAIKENPGYTMGDIRKRDDLEGEEISSAIGSLKEQGIIQIASGGILNIVNETNITRFSEIQNLINTVAEKGEVVLTEFTETERSIIKGLHRKRGKAKGVFRIDERVSRTYELTEIGIEVFVDLKESGRSLEEISRLTPQMLKDGSWKGKSFRKYNIDLPPPRISVGRKHPYKEFLDSLKNKLVALGFEEMRGSLVENEFWNMDALYMPQFHPARDIHDVYYIKEPGFSKEIEEPFLTRVAETHQSGGNTGSRGWKYLFDVEKAKRLMLRSQGTAVSARTLASGPGIPGKYFSIARCFRYEQVDSTHAQDFFQIEGIVLGEDINFRTLLGLLQLFASEVARAKEIEFIPAYFPFTEPSVELHVRHPVLGWTELGGAGIFRPEVTIPLGINVPVIAWGLGIDRMAMVALDIHDIRDLFSPDLDLIRKKRTRWI